MWLGWLAWSCKVKVAGLIPGQGACLGCEFGPSQGTFKKQLTDVFLSLRCFSPSLSPSLPLSLKIKKKIFFKNTEKSKYLGLSVCGVQWKEQRPGFES